MRSWRDMGLRRGDFARISLSSSARHLKPTCFWDPRAPVHQQLRSSVDKARQLAGVPQLHLHDPAAHRKHPRGENWRTLREQMERIGPRSTLPQDGNERKRDTRATCWPTAVVSSLGYLGV
jgi:hypothetical protein